MNDTNTHLLRGSLCTMLGGVCWGFSGTCGQYLFSRFGVSSLWLTCLRLLSGGIIMLLVMLIRPQGVFGSKAFAGKGGIFAKYIRRWKSRNQPVE